MMISKESKFNMMLMQTGLINDICKPLFREGDLTNYVFVEINGDGDFTYLNTDSNYFNEILNINSIEFLTEKFINEYISKGYHLQASHSEYINRLFEGGIAKINERFNLGNFLFVVNVIKRNKNSLVQINRFGSDVDNRQVNNFYINRLSRIKEFTYYFPHRMESFLRKIDKFIYCNDRVDVNDRIQKINKCQTNVDEEQAIKATIKTKNHIEGRKTIIITSKERKIIKLSLDGLTAEAIGKKMYMSRRTVEKYISDLKDKLECKSKMHIIGKLHEIGILEII
jgi:DNA-binding CsgD family transcriptional regulator